MRVRSKLSKKNKYYLNQYRYLELKYFCMQYPEWRKLYSALTDVRRCPDEWSDPIHEIAVMRELYLKKIELIEQTAIATDPELYRWIIRGVTENLSFTYISTILGIPCCRDTYYDRYRKFFWLLDKSLNLQVL